MKYLSTDYLPDELRVTYVTHYKTLDLILSYLTQRESYGNFSTMLPPQFIHYLKMSINIMNNPEDLLNLIEIHNRKDREMINLVKKGGNISETEFDPSKYKLIKENHTTNYGHEKLILKGNVDFPPFIKYDIDSKYSNHYKVQYFDKQKEIIKKNVQPIANQKDYFNLFRYGMSKSDLLHQPNNGNDTITLSISLFMPNNKIYEKQFGEWMYKYFINQLRLLLCFKFYFPDGNIRNYLDYYMLEEGFSKISGNDDSLKITTKFTEFDCNDFEDDKIDELKKYMADFYTKIKKIDNYNFSSGLERIMTYFHMASSVININGKVFFTEKPGDFFVYKFSGPFIENINGNVGHITNGYIGQQIRYISVKQINYIWNDILIKRPVHLIWRDAHATTVGFNDSLWIKKCFNIGFSQKRHFFLMPTSIEYEPQWNDTVKCLINGQYYTRSAIAGMVQFMNFTDTDDFLPYDIYKQSIGMTFLLNNINQLEIKQHRPGDNIKNDNTEYKYGIDEYINSSFFVLDYFRKKSLYYSHFWFFRIYNNWGNKSNYITRAEILLIIYLVNTHKFDGNNEYTRFDFIREIEKLRNDITLKDNNALRFILSIYPTKYHINMTIFNFTKIEFDKWVDTKIKINDVIQKYKDEIKDESEKKYYDNLTEDNLKKLGMSCKNTAINNAIEWCINPYLTDFNEDDIICHPANYFSGFYFDEPPSLNSGLLRQPDDIDNAIKMLDDPHKIKLFKTNYKIDINDIKYKWTNENIDKDGNIKLSILNSILDLNLSIKEQLIKIHGSIDIKPIIIPFIWKSLLVAGYNVPADWIKYNNSSNDAQKKLNELIINVSQNKLWIETTIKLLNLINIKFDNTMLFEKY